MQKSKNTKIAEILDLLKVDMGTPVTIVSVAAFEEMHVPPFSPSSGALIVGITSVEALAHIQSLLKGFYPAAHEMTLLRDRENSGLDDERVNLEGLISCSISSEAALFVPAVSADASFDAFQEVIAHLRAPDGCPWDRKQTHNSLRSDLLSEVYEVLDALDADDMHALCEELGDLLLQIVMHAQIAREESEFSMVEVLQGINRKLVHRHPHVFGDVQVAGEENVLTLWEEIKAGEREKNGKAQVKGMLDGVPKSSPALAQAYEYQDRVARVGFDWDTIVPVWGKVLEELNELREAENPQAQMDEMGDMLFALVNLARWLKIDPESALRETNQRFLRRFRYVEQGAKGAGRSLKEMSLEEMDVFWEEAKRLEKDK